MLHLDEQALEATFWATELSYTANDGSKVILPDECKFVMNQPSQNIDDTKPWVKFNIVPGDSAIDATGTVPFYRQLGTAFLNINVPTGYGMNAAKEMRDQFTSAFRGWKSEDGHCSCYKLGVNTFEQETYAQIKVTVYWESLRRPE